MAAWLLDRVFNPRAQYNELHCGGQDQLTSLFTAAQQNGGAVDSPQVVVELLAAQPMSTTVVVLFFILSFIFVPPLDSAAFTLASSASLDLPPDGQPPRWHRLVWAFVLSGTALSLMYLGGLKILQAASVVVGLPLVGVMTAMVISFMKHLEQSTRS